MSSRESYGNARVDKYLKSLDETVSALRDEGTESECTISDAKEKVESIIWAYEQGKPLYSREMLLDLDTQLSRGGPVKIMGIVGQTREHETEVDDCYGDRCDTYRIYYGSYQHLVHFSASYPKLLVYVEDSLGIHYTKKPESSGSSVDDVQKTFESHQKAWLGSAMRTSTLNIVEGISSPVPINKIICFGLGRLDWPGVDTNENLATSVRRCSKQHAFALTMAEAVRTWCSASRTSDVKCYAQDPAYDAVEKEVLKNVGITVLDDPKGFLEVDQNTMVISSSPNIPVKQVVADGIWPAAMIWNRVIDEGEERTEWEKQDFDGEEHWVSPYCTDPDSPRVRNMVSNYITYPIPNDDEVFGNMAIYIKK